MLYRSEFRGGTVFLEQAAFTFLFYPAEGVNKHHAHTEKNAVFHALRMDFEGALPDHKITQEGRQPFYHNYYLGKDPTKWAPQVPLFKIITHTNMYPGIDVKVHSTGNNVRYDFIVQPGADPSLIALKFTGQNRLLLRNGKLLLLTAVGEIEQTAPYTYQVKNGTATGVACHYVLIENKLKIKIDAPYDKALPLVIDPAIIFSTFTGSSSDNWGMSASYDQQGNAYTAGISFGPGYPITLGAFQASFAGQAGDFDISLSKFNASGNSLIYSTYLGGPQFDSPQSITVDNSNCLIVLGRSYSNNFPMVSGCYNTAKNGSVDIVVVKFDPNGASLLGSTFIGGSKNDGVNITDDEGIRFSLKRNYSDDARGAVHVDENDNIYVASCTSSPDFPVTPGCFQAANAGGQDGCVFKLNPLLNTLLFSTYLGGSANDAVYNLAIDKQDQLYVTGGTESSDFPVTPGALHTSYQGNTDGFITHFSFSGSTLLQSSYIGTPAYDQSYFVQTDKSDNVYLFGQSAGSYPVTTGTYFNNNSGQFLHKLNLTLNNTVFSTAFGSGRGTPDIVPSAFLVDNCENIYVSGWGGPLAYNINYNDPNSSTTGMPVTLNAFQAGTDGSDFYFAAFKKNAQMLKYATFFGGATTLEHVDGGTSCFDKTGMCYQAICGGCGGKQDMPTTPGVWSGSNNSGNCNNALVKFQVDLLSTLALANASQFIKTGCAPFTVNFLNNSSNAISYFWSFGDGATSNQIAPAHTFTTPGVYKVMLIATDSSTCNQVDTDYVKITVLPPNPAVPQLNPAKICRGTAISLSINYPTPCSYTWAPNYAISGIYSSNPVVAPLVSTIYTLTLNDTLCGNGVSTRTVLVDVKTNTSAIVSSPPNACVFNTLVLSTNPACLSYTWGSGQTTPTVQCLIPGLYSIQTVDSNGCKGSDSIYIYKSIPVSSSFNTLCGGQNVQLSSVFGSYRYQWIPAAGLSSDTIYNPVASPMATTIYTLTLTNGYCKSSASHTVFIKPAPNAKISSNRTDFCTADTIRLSTDPSYPSYLWNTGDTGPVIKTLVSGLYSVTIADTNGCTGFDSLRIIIYPPLVVIPSFNALCYGQSLQLFAPAGSYSYKWFPTATLSGATVYNPIVQPLVSTIYTLVISNGPCAALVLHTVVVNPTPSLELSPLHSELLPGENVQLHARADTVCTWYPNSNLSCFRCNTPLAGPENSTTYYCYVVNRYGCSNTKTLTVDVTPTFYVPNTFTPNGDGLNDVFRPAFTGYKELNIMIFDRWGELLYTGSSPESGWNGSYKGQEAEQGQYVYKIKAVDYQNRKIEKTGPVILLR